MTIDKETKNDKAVETEEKVAGGDDDDKTPVAVAEPVTSSVLLAKGLFSAPTETEKATEKTEPVVATAVSGKSNATSDSSKKQNSSPALLKNLGREPCEVTCPFCSHVGCTRVEQVCDTGSAAASGVMLFLGCVCCCCFLCAACIPCCFKKMQKTEHRCVNCNRIVGEVPAFSDF